MKDIRRALELGRRTLLAMTCWGCGVLQSADEFERYARKRGQTQYIDRRCRTCRWRHMTDPAKRGDYANRMVQA